MQALLEGAPWEMTLEEMSLLLIRDLLVRVLPQYSGTEVSVMQCAGSPGPSALVFFVVRDCPMGCYSGLYSTTLLLGLGYPADLA